MSNVNEIVGPVCPEFPVERYARELRDSVDSPVLSSRLVVILENLDRVIDHYDASLFTDEQLDFVLGVLSSVLILTVAVLRYKGTDRSRVVNAVVLILNYIADHYPVDQFPEFCSSVPRGTVSSSKVVPAKKVGVKK